MTFLAQCRRARRLALLFVLTLLLLNLTLILGKKVQKQSEKSRKRRSEEQAAVDETLKQFVCPGHEEPKPKQKAVFKAAQQHAATGSVGEALRCAIHASRLKPLDSPQAWRLAAELLSRLSVEEAGEFSRVSVCDMLGMAAACRGEGEQRLARAREHASCLEKKGNHEAAASTLARLVEKDNVLDSKEAALHAANLIAEMAMTGKVSWEAPRRAFEELHRHLGGGNAYSLRSFALVHTQLGNFAEAIDLFEMSVSLQPDAYTHSQAVVTCNQLKRYDCSLRHAHAARSLEPSDVGHHRDVAQALIKLGRYPAALDELTDLRKKLPNDHTPFIDSGIASMGLGRYKDAAKFLEKGMELGAADYKLWLLAGTAHTKDGRKRKAMKAYAAAHKLCHRGLMPEQENDRQACVLPLARQLEMMQGECGWSRWAEYEALGDVILRRIAPERVLTPFQVTKGPFNISTLHAMSMLEAAKKRPPTPLPALSIPEVMPGEPFRVGFLWIGTYDSEFANNVITMLETMAAMPARSPIDMFWFSLNDAEDDTIGEYKCKARAKKLFGSRFVHVTSGEERLDQADYSEGTAPSTAIRQYKLHMLFNLPGWLNEASMAVSAAVPAQLQIAFKGYAGTIGADYVQHLVSDSISSPPELSAHYSEKLVYLPFTYYPVANAETAKRPEFQVSSPAPTREELGLPPSGTVFGAFNDHYKIDPDTFQLWMRVLHAASSSVLWSLAHGGEHNLNRTAQNTGVDGSRLVFSSFFPKTTHLAVKGQADLFLDTPLYNAHSTASDMLWARLPVLTLPQLKMAARAAASILHAGGVSVGIARTASDYVEIATRLAARTPRLRAEGGCLSREALVRSPLFDVARFAGGFRRALQMLMEAHDPDDHGRRFHLVVSRQ